MFYDGATMQTGNTVRSSRRFWRGIPKHPRRSWRHTNMQAPIRPLAFVFARSLAMVALAVLLILVLLPAALAAQAASAV
jgi:hypothetical protein